MSDDDPRALQVADMLSGALDHFGNSLIGLNGAVGINVCAALVVQLEKTMAATYGAEEALECLEHYRRLTAGEPPLLRFEVAEIAGQA